MCGIAGFIDLTGRRRADPAVLNAMMGVIAHRGQDGESTFVEGSLAIGFRRLAILDVPGGRQPFLNEDGSVVLFCNGEIFDYIELRTDLIRRGHRFRSRCDVEVMVHMYEEAGINFLNDLNGQFAAVIFDKRKQALYLARDHCGIAPLHYGLFQGTLVFSSEIKAVLQHPLTPRRVDLTGLEQVMTFPGLVSPRTMFEGISSLQPGHYMRVENGNTAIEEYWDLIYPHADATEFPCSEQECAEELAARLQQSVRLRQQSDVPIGVYLSGGLDSSLVAAMMAKNHPGSPVNSISIAFPDPVINEGRFQRLMAQALVANHEEVPFAWSDIASRFREMVWHAECPVRETYNTCMLALSQAARSGGLKVVLGGQGADELFGGYIGYRFDQAAVARNTTPNERLRRQWMWGDPEFGYERSYSTHWESRRSLYSHDVRGIFTDIDCTRSAIVNHERLHGRHRVHKRSYLDFKLRLSDHLLGDHGDRMSMANSVEGRYPFLDRSVVEYATRIPPEWKVRNLREKHILKEASYGLVPATIVNREKFGFRAPGSHCLLGRDLGWVDEILSEERIAREGYFDPKVVESLKLKCVQPRTVLHPHLDDDLLLIVLSFGVFLETFRMPAFGKG